MSTSSTPKIQKFRVALERAELVTLVSLIEKDAESLLENAALLLTLKKVIRKIDFNVLEPAFASAPSTLGMAATQQLVQKMEEQTLEKLSQTYASSPEELSEEEVSKVILHMGETRGQSLTSAEKEIFNKALAKKMGF